MSSPVTAILLNYRRPRNIGDILDRLKTQTARPETLIIDNSGGRMGDVQIPWNGGCFARLLFSVYAETPWVMWISDDVCPTDNDFVADALATAGKHPGGVTGISGHGFNRLPPHYVKMQNATGPVPVVKGILLLFHRSLLAQVRLARGMLFKDAEYLTRCDDLYLSLETGRGEAAHWADEGLLARTEALPGADRGLCREPGHYAVRERFCADWLREVGDGD